VAKHHATGDGKEKLLVGFWKVRLTGKASITGRRAWERGLSYGWIDGVRRRIDREAIRRFNPRKPAASGAR